MKQLLIITGDTNDADYVTEIIEVEKADYGDTSLMDVVRKVAKVLEETDNRHNWNLSEYGNGDPKFDYADQLTEEEVEIFNENCPYGEYGIHSITSIRLLTVTEDEQIFNDN